MIKLYAYLAAALALFGGGWTAANWHRDSIDLATHKERQEILNEVRKKESGIALEVEKKLSELKANERIIETKTREVIERPIYSNVCIDDDGLQLFRSYAVGDTAKLIAEMSRAATDTDGEDRQRSTANR